MGFWFGATVPVASKSKAGWKYVNGETMTFHDWRLKGKEPSGDGKCARFFNSWYQFKWNDSSCKKRYYFICEVSADEKY